MTPEVSLWTIAWCALRYLGFVLPFAGLTLLARWMWNVPREVSRKLLHLAAFSSAPLIMWFAGSWKLTVATMETIGIAVWPILAAVERQPWYGELFVQRHLHEVRRSLLSLFWGNGAIVAWCWGLCGQPAIAVAAILMWGVGDAAAALVGKRWGRHHTGLPFADPLKTWEGSAAMIAASTVVGIVTLMLIAKLAFGRVLAFSLVTSLVGAYVELVTKRGHDTLTVPTANAATLLLLVSLFA